MTRWIFAGGLTRAVRCPWITSARPMPEHSWELKSFFGLFFQAVQPG